MKINIVQAKPLNNAQISLSYIEGVKPLYSTLKRTPLSFTKHHEEIKEIKDEHFPKVIV